MQNREIVESLSKIEEILLRIEASLKKTGSVDHSGDIHHELLYDTPKNQIFKPKTTGFDKLSEDTGLTVDSLRLIFDTEGQDVRLLVDVEGKNETERQAKASICLLTLYHYLLVKNEILSHVLTKKLQWLGIKSLPNLSKTLKDNKQFIIPNGKPGSQNYSYKLTYPGIRAGLEIIKKLCANT